MKIKTDKPAAPPSCKRSVHDNGCFVKEFGTCYNFVIPTQLTNIF